MRNTLSLLAVTALLAAGFVYAQTRTSLRANIPFSFRVGNALMPAGQYEIGEQTTNGILALRGMTTNAGALLVTTGSPEKNTAPEHSSLIFRRYGNDYFLATIWQAGAREGRSLTPGSAEREIAKKAGGSFELASVPMR